MSEKSAYLNYSRSVLRTPYFVLLLLALCAGCAETPKYGSEMVIVLPGERRQVWAVGPALNLSGQREVDPLLQSDLLYHKLQEVRGLTVIPVDRVVQVYAALKIESVQSPTQAAIVCQALGADALIVPTVTAYDPYEPPKWGGSLQMFRAVRSGGPQNVDVKELVRLSSPNVNDLPPPPSDQGFVQSVGMFDAANGTVREALMGYAKGRNDPQSPMGAREYLMSMDRYVGFAYHTLIGDLLRSEAKAQRAKGTS